jgi:O-antigen/teichoic acid export membrane protein
MLVNRLTRGITTFVLSAAIARTLGAHALGQYLLAFSFYYVFVSLASQGFKTLFTREIARNPEATPVYLVSGTLLQFVFSIVGYLLMTLVVFMLPYSNDTSTVCYILGLTLIPFSLSNITEAIFQASERMHLIAAATVPIYILRVIAMIWAMQATNRIENVAAIMVISETIILAIEWLLVVRIVKPQWQIDREFMWNTMMEAKTLFAIEGIGMIAAKTDTLILSLLGSEVLVGLYGSVMQLIQPFAIVSGSLNLAAFPAMSKAVDIGRDKQRQEVENTLAILLCIGLPFLLCMFFYGSDLLLLIYQKSRFLEASTILNLISIAAIISTCAQTLSYVLLANGLERFNLIEVVITSISGSLVGILLISEYQLLGAALMNLFMAFMSFGAIGFAIHRRIFPLRLWPLLRLPLGITVLMLAIFLTLKYFHASLWLAMLLAGSCYTAAVGAWAVFKLGGLEKVGQKIAKLRS